MVRMRHQPTDAERENISEQTTTGNYLGETSDTAGQEIDASNTTDNVDYIQTLPIPKIYIESNPNNNRALEARGFDTD